MAPLPRPLRRLAAALTLIAALLATAPSAVAGPDDDAILTPVAMEVLDPPVPVRGADGRMHLAYEIAIANQAATAIRIDRVQPRTDGEPFGAPVAGAGFSERLRVFGHEGEMTIPPGGSSMLYMDVRYPPRTDAPRRLNHGWVVSKLDSAGVDRESFLGVGTRVSRAKPLVVEPPLRGSDWLNANGCCLPIGGHRGGTLPVDGTIHVGERFAIDFVGLDAAGRLFDGPKTSLSSYGFFGAPVRSATAGRVVDVQDDQPEQVPGILPSDLEFRQYGGNYVTVRVAPRRFAFYGHLAEDSVRVEVGDRVRPGKLLGLLGNTGHTDAPHLHFQIMDRPSPLQSNGLPFVFTRFRGAGYATDLEGMPDGLPLPIAPRMRGAMRDRMPIAQQVVDFPR